MTNPDHQLIGERVRLTDEQKPLCGAIGYVAIVGVPEGQSALQALVLVPWESQWLTDARATVVDVDGGGYQVLDSEELGHAAA